MRTEPKDSRQYQKETEVTLKTLFGRKNVRKEWDVAKDSQDDFQRDIYCPRVDLAVGPFNIKRTSRASKRGDIGVMYERHQNLINQLRERAAYQGHHGANRNPRCFLAIEIENKSNRKQMLGSLLNAGGLGEVGIVIGWDQKVTEALCKIQSYLDFLWENKKIRSSLDNTLIIERSNFDHILLQSV